MKTSPKYNSPAAAKPEKFVAYRKRRPERPPAGKIAKHTKGQSLHHISIAVHLNFLGMAYISPDLRM
jgi:hypothetical protein